MCIVGVVSSSLFDEETYQTEYYALTDDQIMGMSSTGVWRKSKPKVAGVVFVALNNAVLTFKMTLFKGQWSKFKSEKTLSDYDMAIALSVGRFAAERIGEY